jgi:hypothetical protein
MIALPLLLAGCPRHVRALLDSIGKEIEGMRTGWASVQVSAEQSSGLWSLTSMFGGGLCLQCNYAARLCHGRCDGKWPLPRAEIAEPRWNCRNGCGGCPRSLT